MKKFASLITSTMLLAACNPTPAPVASQASPSSEAMNMPATQHDAMPAESATSPAGAPASASGTVESVDVAAGKITIAHGAVPALKWPPMTMAFAATPEQLAAVKPGQQVDFDFVAEGMDATLTSIRNR